MNLNNHGALPTRSLRTDAVIVALCAVPHFACYDFGGGPGIGGDGGDSTKSNWSNSETKDNSATAGGDNYGGGEGNHITIGSDAVAIKSLDTVKEVITKGAGALLEAKSLDSDIAKVFAQANLNASNGAVQKISELAETKITDGANLNQKTTIIALAIGGAVLLFSVLKRGK
jgi:hypothetical protein